MDHGILTKNTRFFSNLVFSFVNIPWFSNKHMFFTYEICTRLTLLFHGNGDLVVAHSSVVVLRLHLLVTIRFHFSKFAPLVLKNKKWGCHRFNYKLFFFH